MKPCGQCGRQYNDQGGKYATCFDCYEARKADFSECVWCGKWHGKEFDTCYSCRQVPGRVEATKRLRLAVFDRDGFTCRNCGTHEGLQVDHIKPCAKGGSADIWNLQTLCKECNHAKADDWNPDYARRYDYQVEQYYGPLYSYLSAEEQDRLYLVMKDDMMMPDAEPTPYYGITQDVRHGE